jgi:hypothetical protein
MKVAGTIRTEEEILARVIERKPQDPLRWEIECYLPYISIDTMLSKAEELNLNATVLLKFKECLEFEMLQSTPRRGSCILGICVFQGSWKAKPFLGQVY